MKEHAVKVLFIMFGLLVVFVSFASADSVFSEALVQQVYQESQAECEEDGGIFTVEDDLERERCETKTFVQRLLQEVSDETMAEMTDVRKQCQLRREIEGREEDSFDPCETAIYEVIGYFQKACQHTFDPYTEAYYECPRLSEDRLNAKVDFHVQGAKEDKEESTFLTVMVGILNKLLYFLPILIIVGVIVKVFNPK